MTQENLNYAAETIQFPPLHSIPTNINALSFNKFVEKLDFIREESFNACRVKINRIDLLTPAAERYDRIEDNMRTVQEVIEATEIELTEPGTINQKNVLYTILNYLKTLPRDAMCDESCLDDIELALEYDLDLDWEFDNPQDTIDDIRNKILAYELRNGDYNDYSDPRGICSRADDNYTEGLYAKGGC